MFSGPWQKVFKCTAPNRLANADLTTPGAEPSCAFDPQVKWMYRTTSNTWSTYTPGQPRPANMATTTTMDGETVDFIVRWERGVIDRFIYSIATLSPASQAATPDLSAWNGVLLDKFEGGVAIGHYQGNPQRDSMLYRARPRAGIRNRVLDGHRHRDALQPPARRGDGDHGQGPLRLGATASRATRSPSAAPVARSSSTSTARTTRGCSTLRSRSTRIPTWSRRRSTSATASCSSGGPTRR